LLLLLVILAGLAASSLCTVCSLLLVLGVCAGRGCTGAGAIEGRPLLAGGSAAAWA
jgi:hypothetical protein